LVQEGGEGALEQSPGGGVRDLLQGQEIDVQTGAGVAEGAAGDNFAPLGCQVTEVLELFGCKPGSSHDLSFLGLAPMYGERFFGTLYRKGLHPAKSVLASSVAKSTAWEAARHAVLLLACLILGYCLVCSSLCNRLLA
jgi:hypothetical protein